jgi:hypothetical protein
MTGRDPGRSRLRRLLETRQPEARIRELKCRIPHRPARPQ